MREGDQEGLVERSHVSDLLQVRLWSLHRLVESLLFVEIAWRLAVVLGRNGSLHDARILLPVLVLDDEVVRDDASQPVQHILGDQSFAPDLVEAEAEQAEQIPRVHQMLDVVRRLL